MEDNVEKLKLDDISKDLLVLNKITIEKLFETKDENAITLYLFYYKTAKWQGTNQVFANDAYVRKCLGWGSKKVTDSKNILKDMKLIETMQVRQGNRIGGWYIKVNYFSNFKNTHFEELQNSTSSKQETNALKEYIKCLENNIEMLNKEIDNNKLLSTKKKTKKEFTPPTLEEVEAYCEERDNGIDPQSFIDFYESKGWYVGKNKMKNWEAAVRNWERNDRKQTQQPKKETKEEKMDRIMKWAAEQDRLDEERKRNEQNRNK